MIQFNCICGQALSAQESDAGKQTRCPKCSAAVTIPGSTITADVPSSSRRENFAGGRPAPEDYGRDDDYDRGPRRDEVPVTSRKAVFALILGLVSFCIPLILSIPAIILGFLGLADARKGKTGSGFAIAGIVCGFISMFGVLPIAAILVGLLLPAVQKVREAADRMQSRNNLMQIGLAIHDYHDNHKNFPKHAIYDKNGKPLLSWRVAILPYIEQQNLYMQFRLDEPWDSPNNIVLLKRMPKIYAHPQDPFGLANGQTHYQVFVGNGKDQFQPVFSTASSRKTTLSMITAQDGTANTILAVEASQPVPWTKPADMPYFENQPLPGLGLLPRGYNVLLTDGSVRFVDPRRMNAQNLRRFITFNDGAAVFFDF